MMMQQGMLPPMIDYNYYRDTVECKIEVLKFLAKHNDYNTEFKNVSYSDLVRELVFDTFYTAKKSTEIEYKPEDYKNEKTITCQGELQPSK